MNILLQWRHIPCFKGSKAKRFKFRDVTMGGKGWGGYSSIGIGVSDVEGHGSFVLVVGEKIEGEGEGEETVLYEYGTFGIRD
jgi:hypothetical protein